MTSRATINNTNTNTNNRTTGPTKPIQQAAGKIMRMTIKTYPHHHPPLQTFHSNIPKPFHTHINFVLYPQPISNITFFLEFNSLNIKGIFAQNVNVIIDAKKKQRSSHVGNAHITKRKVFYNHFLTYCHVRYHN